MENKQVDENLIDDHKKLLLTTGKLSDWQFNNMKTWAFIVFNDVNKVEINYDFNRQVENPEGEMVEEMYAGEIEYIIHFNKPESKTTLKKGKETLILWTQFMFWKDTKVTIHDKQ